MPRSDATRTGGLRRPAETHRRSGGTGCGGMVGCIASPKVMPHVEAASAVSAARSRSLTRVSEWARSCGVGTHVLRCFPRVTSVRRRSVARTFDTLGEGGPIHETSCRCRGERSAQTQPGIVRSFARTNTWSAGASPEPEDRRGRSHAPILRLTDLRRGTSLHTT